MSSTPEERAGGPRALAPPETEDISSRIGPLLVLRLAATLRTAASHGVSNQVFLRHMREFLATAAPLLSQGELSLAAAAGYLHVNGVRVLAKPIHLAVHRRLMADLARLGVGGLLFLQMPDPDEMARAIEMLLAEEAHPASSGLSRRLKEMGIESVQALEPIGQQEERPEAESPIAASGEATVPEEHRLASEARASAIHALDLALRRTRRNGYPDLRKAQRIVQPLVERVIRREDSLLDWAALRHPTDGACGHCVDVAILSIAAGRELGLGRAELADIGVCALLHDLGRLEMRGALPADPGRCADPARETVRHRRLSGARLLARAPGLSLLLLDAMETCLWQPFGPVPCGSPPAFDGATDSPIARIVAVADRYDALTTPRTPRSAVSSPKEAIERLRASAGSRFDPAIVCALSRALGCSTTDSSASTRALPAG